MLKKLGLNLSKQEIEAIVNMEPDSIEKTLLALRFHLEQYMTKRRGGQVPANDRNMVGDENNAVNSNF